MKQFSDAYAVKMEDDLATLNEVSTQLDGILFDDYVKRKSGAISDIISTVFSRQGLTGRASRNPPTYIPSSTNPCYHSSRSTHTYGASPNLSSPVQSLSW